MYINSYIYYNVGTMAKEVLTHSELNFMCHYFGIFHSMQQMILLVIKKTNYLQV